MGHRARAPSTCLQETKPILKLRSCSLRPRSPPHFRNHHCAHPSLLQNPGLTPCLHFPRVPILPQAEDWIISTIFITTLCYPRSGLVSPLLFLPNPDSTCFQGLPSVRSSPLNKLALVCSPPHVSSPLLSAPCSCKSALPGQPRPPHSQGLYSGHLSFLKGFI